MDRTINLLNKAVKHKYCCRIVLGRLLPHVKAGAEFVLGGTGGLRLHTSAGQGLYERGRLPAAARIVSSSLSLSWPLRFQRSCLATRQKHGAGKKVQVKVASYL